MGLEATRKGGGGQNLKKAGVGNTGGGGRVFIKEGEGGVNPSASYDQYISSFFRLAVHHIVFSPVCACWSFHLWRRNMTFLDTEMKELWRWNMTSLDMEMKELGKSTQHNTHNARSMIHTYPQVCPRHCCRWNKPLRWKSINTHSNY